MNNPRRTSGATHLRSWPYRDANGSARPGPGRSVDEARPSSLSMAGDARSGLARLTPNTLSKSVDVRSR
jgi:hypothetical protein